MPNTPWYDKSPMPIRAAGVLLATFGLIGMLFGVAFPSTINVREILLTAVGLPPLALGILYVALGQKVVPYLGEPQNARSWRLRYWAPLFVTGAVLAWVLRSHNGA